MDAIAVFYYNVTSSKSNLNQLHSEIAGNERTGDSAAI